MISPTCRLLGMSPSIHTYIPLRGFEQYQLAELIPQPAGSPGEPKIGHVLTLSLLDQRQYGEVHAEWLPLAFPQCG
jgi:hypothetical protein